MGLLFDNTAKIPPIKTMATPAPVPGMLSPGNLNLMQRPMVKNPDGSVSTVKSMSFNFGGREVLIPLIHPMGFEMTPAQAVRWFQRSRQHLGTFDTPKNATAYAEALHQQQAQDYGLGGK